MILKSIQHRDGYFLVSVYEDTTLRLSHYGQLPSHLVLYPFHTSCWWGFLTGSLMLLNLVPSLVPVQHILARTFSGNVRCMFFLKDLMCSPFCPV